MVAITSGPTGRSFKNAVRSAARARMRNLRGHFPIYRPGSGQDFHVAAALYYLTHRLPEITDGEDDLQWASPDFACSVAVPDGQGVVVMLDDGTGPRPMADPLAAAAAILSAWMTVDPTMSEEEQA